MASKLKPYAHPDGTRIGYLFKCPGCGERHPIATERPNEVGARWSFNGDQERPAFSPSVLLSYDDQSTYPVPHIVVCHSFVREGRIEFLPDCTHALAGQTVDLPDWD